jgi:hypothetical protein
MTRGVLIFAFNNSEVDYVKMAAYAGKRAKEFLQVPVSIVTDSLDIAEKYSHVFDKIIFCEDNSTQLKRFYEGSDNYKQAVWRNNSRSNCYDLTPYDETLVIDSDFIINSNFLSFCWDQPHDFLIYDRSLDLASWRDTTEFEFVSQYGIKFYWATVFFFRKTNKTQSFFKIVEHVKNNWNYYQRLYQLPSTKFRNDYAFSIAINIIDPDVDTFQNKIAYITDRDYLLSHKDNKMQFLVQKKGANNQYTALSTNTLDVHVMSKSSLLDVIEANNE